jgi:hypothetical protein
MTGVVERDLRRHGRCSHGLGQRLWLSWSRDFGQRGHDVSPIAGPWRGRRSSRPVAVLLAHAVWFSSLGRVLGSSPHPYRSYGVARPAQRLDSTALGRRSLIRMRSQVQVLAGHPPSPAETMIVVSRAGWVGRVAGQDLLPGLPALVMGQVISSARSLPPLLDSSPGWRSDQQPRGGRCRSGRNDES